MFINISQSADNNELLSNEHPYTVPGAAIEKSNTATLTPLEDMLMHKDDQVETLLSPKDIWNRELWE